MDRIQNDDVIHTLRQLCARYSRKISLKVVFAITTQLFNTIYIAIIFCGFMGPSFSATLAPCPSKCDGKHQQPATYEQQFSNPDKPPPRSSLLPRRRTLEIYTFENHDETASERYGSHWDSPNWWLVGGTIGLIIVTGILAIYTAKLYKTTAQSAQDAQIIANSQFDEIRHARILQHRPRLHVRNVVVDEPKFKVGLPIRGQFYVSNTGGSNAHVVDSYCEVFWSQGGLPMKRPYEGKNGNGAIADSPTISAGESARGRFESHAAFDSAMMLGNKSMISADIYVMGWIEYTDDISIRRRTAFCRRYEVRDESRRFYPVSDPDYEHEE